MKRTTTRGEPSKASLREIPEADFTKGVRPNPYAARLHAERSLVGGLGPAGSDTENHEEREMPLKLTGSEKTRAQVAIMALVMRWLRSAGFELVGEGKKNGTFKLRADDGVRLVLCLDVPAFDSFFRLSSSWEDESGSISVGGPHSDPFACPNTPGRRRYTFRFNGARDSQERCATNIQDWVRDELLPWFVSRPKTHWSNPRVITT